MNDFHRHGGILTWEYFEEYVPNNPRLILLDFLHSKQDSFMLFVSKDEDTVIVMNIDRDTAKRLLEEAG